MDSELQAETRILVGRLSTSSDPARPWWWQASTTIDGNEMFVGGFALTERQAILDAAASTIELGWHDGAEAQAPQPKPDDRYHEPGWWPGLNDQD
jgi:hypothetical protein